MSQRLSAEQFATYRALAEAMLPGTARSPAAAQAGVADRLDAVLALRPDLVADFMTALRLTAGRPPFVALAELSGRDPEAYRALRTILLGSYFLDDKAMRAVGYTGQQSRPLDPEAGEEPGLAALLAPVVARGQIWRAAP